MDPEDNQSYNENLNEDQGNVDYNQQDMDNNLNNQNEDNQNQSDNNQEINKRDAIVTNLNEEELTLEDKILDKLNGGFAALELEREKKDLIVRTAKEIDSSLSDDIINRIYDDINNLGMIEELVTNEDIEDIAINNTSSIFAYFGGGKTVNMDFKFNKRIDLVRFVKKLMLYSTNSEDNNNIVDVHMKNGSRANIINSPRGYDVTIRNFKKNALSVLDLINFGEFDYNVAARLWLYMDGFNVRPANILIAGMPSAGKTSLLNSLFSFIRPDERVITMEETYELDTSMSENVVNLETNNYLPMVELVKNSLRMRPDMLIIGEVRGPEANDMITAMNVGNICLGTIHATSSRDIINRLENSPMNVPMGVIPAIDALIVLSKVYIDGKPIRKIIQISEISGIETQILLSDLYKFDYKTHRAAAILPSVTYRDRLSQAIGVPPPDILAEESVRVQILMRLNQLGIRDIKRISQVVQEYYSNPDQLLVKLGLNNLHPIIRI